MKCKRIITLFMMMTITVISYAQVFSTKFLPSTAEDYVLLLQREGYQSYSIDISALKNENYLVEPVIRHYKGGKQVENPFDFGIAFNTHDSKSVSEKVRVGFSPGNNPSIRMMNFHVSGAIQIPLLFDEQKNPKTGEVDEHYGYRPFVVEQIELGKFIPIALCGAYWYDEEGELFRFCGDNEITPSMNEDILKSIEEYYVIGMIIKKQ